MGTRAIIRINEKPVFATHWDGYPESLGQDLVKLKNKTISNIMRVAKKHTIDSASPIVRKKLNEERVKKIAKRHNLSTEKVKKGIRRGSVITVDDYEIGQIGNYGDFAEYEYDVNTSTGEVKVRERSGEWTEKSSKRWKKVKIQAEKKKLKRLM